MKAPGYILAVAALAALGWIIVAGLPGCHPRDHDAVRGEQHADSSRIAEAVADLYRPQIVRDSLVIAAYADSMAATRAETQRLTRASDAANAEADRLLNLYVNSLNSGEPYVTPGGESGHNACSAALDACTDARREASVLIAAQRVEIAALSDQVSRLSRLDSLRAGETLALRTALGQMQEAYSSMSAAYGAERARYLREKRRRIATQIAAVGAVAATVYLMR